MMGGIAHNASQEYHCAKCLMKVHTGMMSRQLSADVHIVSSDSLRASLATYGDLP